LPGALDRETVRENLACERASSNDGFPSPIYKTIAITAPNPSISFVSKCIHDLVATQAGKAALVAEEKPFVIHVIPQKGVENYATRCDVRVLHVSMFND
jgi:hypothetical protein